jgi:uncharacterized oligopeptide transporter (OPT) family protein
MALLALSLQDFKTGYYTLASPKALFVSQLAGAFCGVLVAPGIYKFYTTSFPIGVPGTQYSVPFATVYRLMSVVSANGFHDLPDYCLAIGGAPRRLSRFHICNQRAVGVSPPQLCVVLL